MDRNIYREKIPCKYQTLYSKFINKFRITSILKEAVVGDHKNIVELMIEKGVRNFNSGIYYVVKGGDVEIILLSRDKNK